jgi:predicted CoA-binding protein
MAKAWGARYRAEETSAGRSGTFGPCAAGGEGEHRQEGDSHAGEVRRVDVKDAAGQFLASRRIAVTGVSRTAKGHGSNVVYQRLRQRGYQVFAVNPNADKVEGDTCYHDLESIPGGVEAVVIGTRPEIAESTVRECARLGVRQVWMHRGPGAGSVSTAATGYGREHGMTVIDGGCPLMFGPTADFGHKVMRMFLSSHVPKEV